MKYLQTAKRQREDIIEIVYMLVDISGSMYIDDYRPSRLEGAIEANMKFIETKVRLHPEDRVGIIGFDGRGYLLCPDVPVGEGIERLSRSFKRDSGDGGGTDFTSALKLAEKCLFGTYSSVGGIGSEVSRFFKNLFMEPTPSGMKPQHVPPADKAFNRRIVMLTDGQHNGFGDPVRIAMQLKNSKVTIECIGIAGIPENVDERMLKKIASIDENGNPRYYFIKDTSELVRKYESMAHHLRVV